MGLDTVLLLHMGFALPFFYTWAFVLAFFHTWAFTLQRSLGPSLFWHMGLYLYPAFFWPSSTAHGLLALIWSRWPGLFRNGPYLGLLLPMGLDLALSCAWAPSSHLAFFTCGPLPLLRPSLAPGPSPLIEQEKEVVHLLLLQGQSDKTLLDPVSSIPRRRWSMMTHLVLRIYI